MTEQGEPPGPPIPQDLEAPLRRATFAPHRLPVARCDFWEALSSCVERGAALATPEVPAPPRPRLVRRTAITKGRLLTS
jgi:hypothetical protein